MCMDFLCHCLIVFATRQSLDALVFLNYLYVSSYQNGRNKSSPSSLTYKFNFILFCRFIEEGFVILANYNAMWL
jgi:hypothetical protein